MWGWFKTTKPPETQQQQQLAVAKPEQKRTAPAVVVDNTTPVNFYSNMSEKLSLYMNKVTQVKTLDEWAALNNNVFGSPSLGVEKIGTGTIFGFVSGYTLRQAMKVGFLVAGYVSHRRICM
jgi:hypothetical protein